MRVRRYGMGACVERRNCCPCVWSLSRMRQGGVRWGVSFLFSLAASYPTRSRTMHDLGATAYHWRFSMLYTSLFHGQVWLSVPAAVQFIFTTLASAFTDIVAPDALRKRFYDNPAHDFDFLAPSCILQHGYSESPPVCFIPRSNTPFRIMPRQETFSCRPGQTGQLRVTSWNQTRPQACAFQHDDETSRQSTREVCSLSWEGGGHRPASLRMTVI